MKNFYLLSLLFIYCVGYSSEKSLSNSANDLYIIDPAAGWWGNLGNATIEEATLTIKPAGTYFEYGLYLTISDDGCNTYHDSNFEIVLDFQLPPKAIVHDSWLWVGSDIIKAVLIDRNHATEVYEGIVQRQQDPSILYKNSDVNYQLRIYPIQKGETRKVKITYFLPMTYSGSHVMAPLPTKIIKTSGIDKDNFHLLIETDQQFSNPEIAEFSQLPSQVNISPNKIQSKISTNQLNTLSSLHIAYERNSPGIEVRTWNDTVQGDSYYSVQFNPASAFNYTSKSKNYTILVDDIYQNNSIPHWEILESLEKILEYNLSPNDKIKIYYYDNAVKQTSNDWITATPSNIQAALDNIPSYSGSGLHPLEQMIYTASNYIKNSFEDSEIILLSNRYSSELTIQAANDILSNIPSDQRVNIICLSYFTSSIDFFTRLANGSNANIYSLSSTGNYLMSTISKAFQSQGDFEINNYKLDLNISGGFTFDEFSSSSGNGEKSTYFKVGKYVGNQVASCSFSAVIDGNVITKNWPVNYTTEDSLLGVFWAGSYLYNWDDRYLNDQSLVQQIKEVSRDHRVLSYHTAFLALEPGDTVQACVTCEDESGTVTTSIEEPTEDVLKSNVFPNPFIDHLNIELLLSDKQVSEAFTISLFDIQGRLVKSIILDAGVKKVLIDQLEELDSGVYFLSLASSTSQETHRILKM